MGMYVPSIADAVVRNRGFPAGPATVCKRADGGRSSRTRYAHSGSRNLRAAAAKPAFQRRAGPRAPGPGTRCRCRGPQWPGTRCQCRGPQWSASDPVGRFRQARVSRRGATRRRATRKEEPAAMARRSTKTPPPDDAYEEKILDIDVVDEMQGSFLEYAYS